jgi:hypothetical protein
VRAILISVLCASAGCAAGAIRSSSPPSVEVIDAVVTGHGITFRTQHRYIGLVDPGGTFELSFATGDCARVAAVAPRSRPPTRAITGTLQAGDHGTLRVVQRAGAWYVEQRRRGGVRHVALPAGHERVEWVVGTSLLFVDRADLVQLDTGTMLRVPGAPHGARFVIVGDRLFVREQDDLVVYDLALEPVARWRPRFERELAWSTTSTVLGPSWQAITDRISVRKTATHLHLKDGGRETSHALPGEARWTPGTSMVVGEDWLFDPYALRATPRRPGPLQLAPDRYLRDEHGEVFELEHGNLHPALWRIGALVSGGPHGVVLADPLEPILWLVSPAGTWRKLPYGRCGA